MKKSYYIVILLIFVYLTLQLPFLTKITNVWADEPWYANTAYNYSIGNGVKNTNTGKMGGDDLFLYTICLGSFFKIFGTSLLISRLFSVFCGVFGILGYILLLKELNVTKYWVMLFGGLLFIFSNVTYIIFRTVRPEGLVLVLIIWSIYYLIRGINREKNIMFLLSGMFITCSFLCHPNTAIYVFLYSIFLFTLSLKRRNINYILHFIAGFLTIFILLMFYVWLIKRQGMISFFESWLYRTSVSSDNLFKTIISNLLRFSKIYSLGFKRIFIYLFELVVLIIGVVNYKKNKNIGMIAALGVLYFVIAISFIYPFTSRYFSAVLVMPLIIYPVLINMFYEDKYFILLLFVGFIYFANNFIGNIYIISRDYKNTPYAYIEEHINKHIPDNTKVLTLLNFWFPLKGNDIYNSYTRWNTKLYKDVDDLILSGHIDYVVISDYLTNSGTATSGRTENAATVSRNNRYYNKVIKFAKSSGKLIDSLQTNNYGLIEIYKIKK